MRIEEMTREQLIEICKKLPLTADGVPITPGMTVYPPCGHTTPLIEECCQPVSVDHVDCWEGSCKEEDWGENDYHETSPTKYDASDCYSTPEAAQSAAKGNP